MDKMSGYYFGEVYPDTVWIDSFDLKRDNENREPCEEITRNNMKSYIITFTADYEEYMLRLSFSMPFSDEESANEFAENDVSHIVVSENGISVISNSESMELCGDYVFKRLNDGSHSKVLLCESDYQFIEKNSREVFNEMCGKYGNREYFVFSISAFSVNFGVILGKSGSGRGYHPWDNINPCPKCGDKAAWLVGKDGKRYESGSPYKIICLKCGYQSISSDDWAACKADWNNN